ncbi:hypothetical protein D3C75_1087320 [compost metagenome]
MMWLLRALIAFPTLAFDWMRKKSGRRLTFLALTALNLVLRSFLRLEWEHLLIATLFGGRCKRFVMEQRQLFNLIAIERHQLQSLLGFNPMWSSSKDCWVSASFITDLGSG